MDEAFSIELGKGMTNNDSLMLISPSLKIRGMMMWDFDLGKVKEAT